MEAVELDAEEHTIELFEEYIFPRWWTFVLIGFSVTVFVVGLTGNALVCVAVYRSRSMRTVTNYFIMNLAIGDFMVILFCLPLSVVGDVTLTWFFGTLFCKTFVYLQTVSATVSALTLTVISIERWYAICHPLKFKSTPSRARTAIIIIWLLALVLDIPDVLMFEAVPSEDVVNVTIYNTKCIPTWSQDLDQSWAMLKMVFLYVVPLIVMGVAYYRIIYVLRKSGQQQMVAGASENTHLSLSMTSNANKVKQLQTRKKAAKMLVSVVIMFAVCLLPVHAIDVLRVLMELENSEYNWAIGFASHCLYYANSAINPLIYNFMSDKFREEFKRSFDCCTMAAKRKRHEMRNFNPLGSLTKSRTSSRQSQQKTSSSLLRSDTLTSKLAD